MREFITDADMYTVHNKVSSVQLQYGNDHKV